MLPNYQARSPFVLKHTTSLYICLDVRMSFGTLTFSYFCVSLVIDPVPNFTKQNPLVQRSLAIITHIILEIVLFTALNSFAGAVETQKLKGVHLYSVSGCGKLTLVVSPTQQFLLEYSLSTRLTVKVSLSQVCSVV